MLQENLKDLEGQTKLAGLFIALGYCFDAIIEFFLQPIRVLLKPDTDLITLGQVVCCKELWEYDHLHVGEVVASFWALSCDQYSDCYNSKECDVLVSMHVNYSDMGGERHLALPDIPIKACRRVKNLTQHQAIKKAPQQAIKEGNKENTYVIVVHVKFNYMHLHYFQHIRGKDS